MKRLSLLCLVVPAALAMVAVMAPASAGAATVLCKEELAKTCQKSSVLPAGSETAFGYWEEGDYLNIMEAQKTETVKRGTCGNFGFGFKTTQESGSPLPAETSYAGINASTCSLYPLAIKTCSSVEPNSPGASIKSIDRAHATIEVGSALQPLTLSFSCATLMGGQFTCEYKASAPASFQINYEEKGIGGFPVVTATEVPIVRTSGLPVYCGVTGLYLKVHASAVGEAISSI